MLSQDGKPAAGQLMFQPSRIISVQDYGLATNYTEGVDYTIERRSLLCTASSRMTAVRGEDLPKGELKWNSIGGKQVMVTYEHTDTWEHPRPSFVGAGLPNTMRKLKAHAPLTSGGLWRQYYSWRRGKPVVACPSVPATVAGAFCPSAEDDLSRRAHQVLQFRPKRREFEMGKGICGTHGRVVGSRPGAHCVWAK